MQKILITKIFSPSRSALFGLRPLVKAAQTVRFRLYFSQSIHETIPILSPGYLLKIFMNGC